MLRCCGLRSRISRHRNRRFLFCLSLRHFSGSYILESGIGQRCSTVSREHYCQCTVPRTSRPIVRLTENMPCLPPTSPHTQSLVTRRSMLLTWQHASIFSQPLADMLEAAVKKGCRCTSGAATRTENSTSHWLAKLAKMLAHDPDDSDHHDSTLTPL